MHPDPYLLDSNILLRLVQPDSPLHSITRYAVDSLWAHGARLCYTSQNLAEFWNVCTRPATKNGLGFSVAETDAYARDLESYLEFLPDNATTHSIWRQLVVDHAVSGVQVHDACLAANLYAHKIPHLITFNLRDFERYPNLDFIDPEALLARLQP